MLVLIEQYIDHSAHDDHCPLLTTMGMWASELDHWWWPGLMKHIFHDFMIYIMWTAVLCLHGGEIAPGCTIARRQRVMYVSASFSRVMCMATLQKCLRNGFRNATVKWKRQHFFLNSSNQATPMHISILSVAEAKHTQMKSTFSDIKTELSGRLFMMWGCGSALTLLHYFCFLALRQAARQSSSYIIASIIMSLLGIKNATWLTTLHYQQVHAGLT